MNFKRPEVTRKATKAAAERNNKRRAALGKMKPVCFHVPEIHIELIQEAADLDQRTMSNFFYHAAVKVARQMLAEGSGK